MDTDPIIRQRTKLGWTWRSVYAEAIPYFNAIKTFLDPDRNWFGSHNSSGDHPQHVNSKRKPFPKLNCYTCNWERLCFGWRFAFEHLHAEHMDADPGFFYLVNDGRNQDILLCIDIDAIKGVEVSDAKELAQRIVENEFHGHVVYQEPSRKRKGWYIWFIVRRASAPRALNKMLCRFSKYLKAKYVGVTSHVDAVKATCQFRVKNPAFDPTQRGLLPIYESRSWKARPEYVYRIYLERHLHCRGTLATMPCAGALARGEGESLRRFIDFVWREKELCVNAIPEQAIADKAALSPPASSPLDNSIGAQPQVAVPYGEDVEVHVPREDGNLAWEMLRSPDVIQSRWGAYFVANQQLRRKATWIEAMQVYEKHGAATGPTHDERTTFFQRIEALITYAEGTGHDPYWITATHIHMVETLLEQKITSETLDETNVQLRKARRGPLTVHDIAMMYCWQVKAIFSRNGYCPHSFIKSIAKGMKRRNPKQKKYHSRQITAAFGLLETVGFSKKTGEKSRAKGICCQYALGECAPILLSRGEEAGGEGISPDSAASIAA